MARSTPETDQGNRDGERPRERAAAVVAYFDTSSFVKLVVEESGSFDARDAWASASRRVSSRLLYVEARSALAAARRARRLSPRGHREAKAVVELLWDAIEPMEIDEELVCSAGELAEDHRLRGYDAVHLASAVAVADAETVLVSADRDLLRAARACRLTTFPLAT